MHIQFCGAAGEVTGSRHLLHTGTNQILLDCGLSQGHRAQARLKNEKFIFTPRELSAVILSHAHIDHSGGLPLLSKNSFRGPIYSTPATIDLARIMLPDSGRIQENDAEFFNKIHAADGQKIHPLYTEHDADQVLLQFQHTEYDTPRAILPNVSLTLLNAGHVLGAAMIQLDVDSPIGKRRILFTGDLGRDRTLLMHGPVAPKDVDYLLIESTYGDRKHAGIENAEAAFVKIIEQAIRTKGKILIPSFALERTQEIVFILEKLRKEKRIPPLPLYVDSPMAVSLTDIFNRHKDSFYFGPDFKAYLAKEDDPFGFEYVHYVRSIEESKRLNTLDGPMIIVSASGMCEGGRILHHLRHNIASESTIILLVGYQAEGTLGRRLSDGQKRVLIFGEEHEVQATVQNMPFFSAHADRDDLLAFIKKLRPLPRMIFLVHGDPSDQIAFTAFLKQQGITNVEAPRLEEIRELS